MFTAILGRVSWRWWGPAFATTVTSFIFVQVLLIAVVRRAGDLAGTPIWLLVASVLAASVLAAAVLTLVGMQVARVAFGRLAGRADQAYARLAREEATRRAYQARTHEVASTVAGLRSASDLLVAGGLAPEHAPGLHAMINSELHRLERVLQVPRCSADADREPGVIDLDMVLRTLVTAHEAKGTDLAWQPSGELLLGDGDDLSAVVDVLLDNAARHGDGTAQIEVRPVDAMVEILVSGGGPGIAPEVRGRLFEWGARGAASPGQGIGLHVARDLMERQGGYLRLASPGGQTPTTFAIGVPALRAEDVADELAGLACEIELGASDGVAA